MLKIILAVWCVGGCMATNFLPLPKTKKQGILILLAIGPVCWLWMILFLIFRGKNKNG